MRLRFNSIFLTTLSTYSIIKHKFNDMITTILLLAVGCVLFLIFYKSVEFFEKI